MKQIEFEANGYTFVADIHEDTPLGFAAMNIPLSDLIQSFKNVATSAGLNPSNIEEMNHGGSQIIFRITS